MSKSRSEQLDSIRKWLGKHKTDGSDTAKLEHAVVQYDTLAQEVVELKAQLKSKDAAKKVQFKTLSETWKEAKSLTKSKAKGVKRKAGKISSPEVPD